MEFLVFLLKKPLIILYISKIEALMLFWKRKTPEDIVLVMYAFMY